MKIILDAGHGGKDPGAIGGNLQEKDLALAIVRKIAARCLPLDVCFTRQDDVFVPINERAKMANTMGADCFVSVHLNSAANFTANGIETLCYSEKGDSYKLANMMQDALIKETGAQNRGVKIRPDLGVLRGTKMTAILIECGFISHALERTKLASAAYQDKIAKTVAAVLKYVYK